MRMDIQALQTANEGRTARTVDLDLHLKWKQRHIHNNLVQHTPSNATSPANGLEMIFVKMAKQARSALPVHPAQTVPIAASATSPDHSKLLALISNQIRL